MSNFFGDEQLTAITFKSIDDNNQKFELKNCKVKLNIHSLLTFSRYRFSLSNVKNYFTYLTTKQ